MTRLSSRFRAQISCWTVITFLTGCLASTAQPPDPPPTPRAGTIYGAPVAAPTSGSAAEGRVAIGTGGAVATGDRHATAAGLEMLAAGGSAVDAAVAAALVLAVTFPEAGNLGGGGFAVVRMDGKVESLDFREVGPAAAHRDLFLDANGQPDAEKSRVGALAGGVPGSPDGYFALHRRYGKLPWPKVVAPAVRIATEGFVVDENLHRKLDARKQNLARFPTSASVWLTGKEAVPVGTLMRFPDLAGTLEEYAAEGPSAITRGPRARFIVNVIRLYGGNMSTEDLANHRAVWRTPITFDAFGWHFASMNLPSSGGIILGQTFGVLERLGWASAPRSSLDRAHLLAEAFRGAYADRFRLGDPSVTEAEPEELLVSDWLDHRAAGIAEGNREKARSSKELEPFARQPGKESDQTTHLSVIDGDGNAVSLTTTLNDLFGSQLWIPGLGFLNDEMDDFAAAPGKPNMFGLVQGEANAVRAGKRMLSSMTPTIAWRSEGGPENSENREDILALGGRGGSRIPTAVAQVLLGFVVDDLPLSEAVAAPRLHHQWLPDQMFYEETRFDPRALFELRGRGHTMELTGSVAVVHGVSRDTEGRYEAVTDQRGPGQAGVATAETKSEEAADSEAVQSVAGISGTGGAS